MAATERILKQDEDSRRLHALGSGRWRDPYLTEIGYAAVVDAFAPLVPDGPTPPTASDCRNAS